MGFDDDLKCGAFQIYIRIEVHLEKVLKVREGLSRERNKSLSLLTHFDKNEKKYSKEREKMTVLSELCWLCCLREVETVRCAG